MIREISSLQKDIRNIQDRYSSNKNNKMKEIRRDNRQNMSFHGPKPSQNMSSRRLISASYFSLEAMVVLVGLTVSLLILPLILPPLPPPPFMLLLIPIGIMVLLMVLAFMPSSNSKHVTSNYM